MYVCVCVCVTQVLSELTNLGELGIECLPGLDCLTPLTKLTYVDTQRLPSVDQVLHTDTHTHIYTHTRTRQDMLQCLCVPVCVCACVRVCVSNAAEHIDQHTSPDSQLRVAGLVDTARCRRAAAAPKTVLSAVGARTARLARAACADGRPERGRAAFARRVT